MCGPLSLNPQAAFRILATGVVVDFNHAAKILKKCKRSRIPWKISGKTALIKNLFKSDDEIDRFKDAKLWTESGIQGKVEKVSIISPESLVQYFLCSTLLLYRETQHSHGLFLCRLQKKYGEERMVYLE